MDKTNIDFLRDVLKEISEVCPTLAGEAEEFVDAIENEKGNQKKIETLENENARLEDELDKANEQLEKYENSFNIDFVGLDTIEWSLEHGNTKIEMRMEAFIKQLQREHAVVPV